MITSIQRGLREDGYEVSISQLCRWFDVPRRTVYYRPTKSAPKLRSEVVGPIKEMIEKEPSFGYRTVANLLSMNKNTVQRVFQLKGWQVKRRPIGHRPRIEALPSVAQRPNERWATDLCRVWGGRDGWLTLALVMDCHTRRYWVGISGGFTQVRVQEMSVHKSEQIVVGVDVGGPRKGFHAVALRDGSYLSRSASKDAGWIVNWCRDIGAQAVGIDAPCRWSTDGRARPAERQKIWCFSTPTRAIAYTHPRKHYSWMLAGEELFKHLESDYVLFDGSRPQNDHRICFETFPQAVACALAGEIVLASQKGTVRRRLLVAAGVDVEQLKNIDWVDAALCAFAAHRLLAGSVTSFGECDTGLIVVPA